VARQTVTITTPVVIPASTSTATLFPTRPPTATPEVLVNGLHQLRLSSVGLTFSYPPEIVRGYSLQEQHVVLRFGLRNAAFIVVAKPRHGYSLEDIARSPHLVNGSFASGPTPTPIAATRIRQFLIDGNPAARVDLNEKDLRVGLVFLSHGDYVLEAAGWAGEMDGDVIYSPSERRQILTWFNQIIATFRFSN
jgi:hypothetical protein